MNSWDDKKKVLTCKSGDDVDKIAKCVNKIQDLARNKIIGVVSDFPELIRVFQTVMHGHFAHAFGVASVDYYSFCRTPDLCPSSCKKWDSRLRSTEFHVINMIHAVQVHGVRCQAATFAIHPGLKVTAISETEETIAEEPAEQGTSAAPPDESVAVEFKSVFAAGEVLNPTSIRRDELGAVVEDSFRIINPPGHQTRKVPFSCLRLPLKNDPVYWSTLADTLKSGETLTVRPDLSFHYCAAKET